MKKIKSWDQSLFKRHEFPQFMSVYTASNFYKLLQLQSMFEPQWSNTNFCQKRAHFHQLHGNEQHIWLKCPAKACSYCTATLEIKPKFCIEDSTCHRTSLWRRSVFFTFFGPQTSTYRELSSDTEPTKQELDWKSRFYQWLDFACSCHTEAQRKLFNTLITAKVTSLELLPQHKKQLLKRNKYILHNYSHSRNFSAPLFQYSNITETHHVYCWNKAS